MDDGSQSSFADMLDRYALPGLLLLAAAVYAPLVGADFVWDDQMLVLDLQERRGSGFLQLFTSDLWAAESGSGPHASAYYRPLTSLHFALLSRVFGTSAPAFHAASVGLHLLCGALLFGLLRRIVDGLQGSGSALLPALGAGLFLFHPLQQEAVAFVSACNDLYAGIACVLGLHLWLRDRVVAAAVCLFVGLLFKETAVVLLLALPVYDQVRGRRPRVVSLVTAVTLYAVLRFGVAGVGGEGLPPLGPAGVIEWSGYWVSALLLPVDVGPYRPLSPLAGQVWPWVAVIVAAGAVVWGAIRLPRILPGALIAVTALTLTLPVSIDHGYAGDRYAYVALVGLAVALVALVGGKVGRWSSPWAVAGAALVGVCIALNVGSLPRWQSHASLMEHGERADPTGRASFELAKSLSATGEYAGALAAGRRAVAEPWPRLEAWPLVAAMELTTGDPAAALEALDEARQLGVPDTVSMLVNRGAAARLLGRDGEHDQAVAGLERLGVAPEQARARIDALAPVP